MIIFIVTPFIHTPRHTSQGTFMYIPLQDHLAKYVIILVFTCEKTRNQKGLETAHRLIILDQRQDWGFHSALLHSKASVSSDFQLREAPVEIQAV